MVNRRMHLYNTNLKVFVGTKSVFDGSTLSLKVKYWKLYLIINLIVNSITALVSVGEQM